MLAIWIDMIKCFFFENLMCMYYTICQIVKISYWLLMISLKIIDIGNLQLIKNI